MSASSSSAFENRARPSSIGLRMIAGFLLMLAINSLVLAYFHDRFWWPPDEGAYAHTAHRVLAGERLNADVEEIHPGYLTFVNAAAFRLFGLRLVSLRYPLVVAALIQSCLLFLMFARRDIVVGVVAGIAAIAMGVLQFLNPTPNWYCLLFATVIAFILSHTGQQRAWRVVAIGVLVGLTFLFRQITGVFVGMAVLSYLLTETRDASAGEGTLLARGLLLLMLAGLLVYLLSATDGYGLVLFGIWPIAFLVMAVFYVRTSNRRSMMILLRMGVGFVLACVPLVLYHAVYGSFRAFIDDTVFRALHVSKFSYLKKASYSTLQAEGLRHFLAFESVATTVNGFFWLVLPLTALALGIMTLRRFQNTRTTGVAGSLPFIAIFYGLVALLQQIPIYLFYALPLIIAALLWLTLDARKPLKWVLTVLTICFSFIAVYYHAAQPITRMLSGIIAGKRVPFVAASQIERAGLQTDADSAAVYSDLIQTIQQGSQPDENILVLPNNPEVYFLAQRKNPFRFWNSAIGIRDEKEASEVLQVMKTAPPRIVVMSPSDRNNTPASAPIVNYVREQYTLVKTISSFEVYRAR